MDFGFMGGSMGVVVGEKLAWLMDRALKLRLPVIVFAASGGARVLLGVARVVDQFVLVADVLR